MTSAAIVATIAVIGVGAGSAAGAADATPAAGVYTFHDLGLNFTPSGVNKSHQVVGTLDTTGGFTTYVAAIWQNGTLSHLPGSAVSAAGISDAGSIAGTDSTEHPMFWANPTSSPSTANFTGRPGGVDEASGYSSWVDLVTKKGYILDATGHTVLTTPAYYWPQGLSRHTFVERYADLAANRYHWYLVSADTGARLADLPDESSTMASDGSIPVPTGIRLADGTVETRPLGGAFHVNARHDLATQETVLQATSDAPIQLQSQVPTGWQFDNVTALGDNGDVIGRCSAPGGPLHGCLLEAHPKTPTLSTSLSFRDASGKVLPSVSPEIGDTVNVRLTVAASDDGAGTIHGIGFTGGPLVVSPASAVSVTGPTPAIPSGLSLAAGRSVSYDYKLTVRGLGVVHLYSTPTGTDDNGAAAKTVAARASYSSATLRVAVSATPKQVELVVDKKTGKITPKKITVTVTVKNTATTPATHVTAPNKLTVGYSDPSTAAVPKVALLADAGPLQAGQGSKPRPDLGTIAAGKSKKVTYTLRAEGDGKYDVAALVIAEGSTGARLSGVGSAKVLIGAPDLVLTTAFGRGVKSPTYPGLLLAGTAFTIKLTLENRSYVHTIGVLPIYGDLSGNAIDGHTEAFNTPIQVLTSPMPVASKAYQLAPRQTKELQLLVRTTSVQAATMVGENQIGGGTRATVIVDDPVAFDLVKGSDGALKRGAQLTGDQEFVSGAQKFEVPLDDSDARPDPEPSTLLGTAWYLSKGALLTVQDLTVGVATALLKELPTLLLHGIQNVPTALIQLMSTQAELWESIKDNPDEVANFLAETDNIALAAYNHAPALLGKLSEFKDALNKSILDSYTKTANDYYHGDYNTALVDISHEFTGQVANAGLLLAPGILARSPRALAAFRAAKASLYATVTEELAPLTSRVVGAIDAAKALATTLKPGFEMNNTVLRKLFGLTRSQANFLRQFAVDNELLIVVRSRAAESIEWLKKGAVLKPEAIKIKNVSWLDAKYLGFRSTDIGRVVVRKVLPSIEDVEALLRKNGFGPADAEWTEALERLSQRGEELTKTGDGYVKQLESVADAGKGQDLKWNFRDNVVDPSEFTDTVTNYGFRFIDDGGGNLVPQYQVDGVWRSVTGDVDFLQITKANGAPLSDAERVVLYQKLSKSPVGFMHPESATWAKTAEGKFDFPAKRNEFIRAGYVAQFGPDNVTRAVTFINDGSHFVSPSDYRILWDGGYQNPLGATSNVRPIRTVGALSSTSVAAGDPLTVTASGFEASEPVDVVVHSTPIHLATVTADAAGKVSTTVRIPKNLPAGSHFIELTGHRSGHTVDLAFTIVRGHANTATGLATTGAGNTQAQLSAALLCLLLGTCVSLGAGRRTVWSSTRRLNRRGVRATTAAGT